MGDLADEHEGFGPARSMILSSSAIQPSMLLARPGASAGGATAHRVRRTRAAAIELAARIFAVRLGGLLEGMSLATRTAC